MRVSARAVPLGYLDLCCDWIFVVTGVTGLHELVLNAGTWDMIPDSVFRLFLGGFKTVPDQIQMDAELAHAMFAWCVLFALRCVAPPNAPPASSCPA